MPDKKSHIEESLRKAFEGFELPPKGEDWKAIEENMQPGNLDEQDSPLRDAFEDHTEDPLEADWLLIAAALDSEDEKPVGAPIPQPFENSLRGAFDDFSMPVTGRDWRIIASRLQLDGAYSFLNWRIVLPLLLLIAVLGTGSYALWNDSNNPRKAIDEISKQKNLNKPDAVPSDNVDALPGKNDGASNTTTPGAIAGGNNTNPGNNAANGGINTDRINTDKPVTTDPKPVLPRNSAGPGSGSHIAGDPGANSNGNNTGPSDNGSGTGNGPTPGKGSEGTISGGTAAGSTGSESLPVLTEANFKDYSHIQGTGLKVTMPFIPAGPEVFNPSALATVIPEDIKVKSPLQPIPAFKREIYAAVQVNRDPGYMVGTITPDVQRSPGVLSGTAASVNLRLEAGLSFKMNNWRFSSGIGVEQTAATSTGTYKIRIPYAFLAHKDQQGETLFLFPRAWRDSVIHVNNGPKTNWVEVPLAIERSFDLNSSLRFRLGLTVNPGLLQSAGGQMANPYMSAHSTAWAYYTQQNTSNELVVNAADLLNKYRIGSGLQIGLSKETVRYDWGIQLQGRYYFNNAYKPGVPATQHNKSYGVQIKFAMKI